MKIASIYNATLKDACSFTEFRETVLNNSGYLRLFTSLVFLVGAPLVGYSFDCVKGLSKKVSFFVLVEILKVHQNSEKQILKS